MTRAPPPSQREPPFVPSKRLPDWASLELSPSVESCGCGLGGIADIRCYIKEEEKETEEKKSHRNYEKNYRYKIDNIYQKAKIKNLE